MELYYYEYNTQFYYPFKDCPWALVTGFLVETPVGILDIREEDLWSGYELTSNKFENIEEFKNWVNKRHNSETAIVILKE